MLKMEKNFIAVNEKGYSRKPYDDFGIIQLMDFVTREYNELNEEFKYYKDNHLSLTYDTQNIIRIQNEIADLSNCLDYLYENISLIVADYDLYYDVKEYDYND